MIRVVDLCIYPSYQESNFHKQIGYFANFYLLIISKNSFSMLVWKIFHSQSIIYSFFRLKVEVKKVNKHQCKMVKVSTLGTTRLKLSDPHTFPATMLETPSKIGRILKGGRERRGFKTISVSGQLDF